MEKRKECYKYLELIWVCKDFADMCSQKTEEVRNEQVSNLINNIRL